ncbi:MAG: HAMP domain-containing histidine kinase [Gammaproteobacteria bacterium]|nr:HAMP domain-containing histidine kinase [Gammaproteobacteria bacterium]
MAPPGAFGRKWSSDLRDWFVFSVLENYRYASPNLRAIALFGVVGEPLFFLIWSINDPKGFESLPLRLIAAALCVPLLFVEKAEKVCGEFAIAVHFVATATYCLPFFFGYLFLMNVQDGPTSIHWPMQHLVALLLLVLVLPVGPVAAASFGAGTTAAWLLFKSTQPIGQVTEEVLRLSLQLMPVYIFIIAAGTVFNRNREIINREKLRTMAAIGSNVAHELRTPFLGIRALAEGIQKYLPTLIQTYIRAMEHGITVEPIRRSHVEGLSLSLGRINSEIEYSNRIVDMLLINSSESPVHADEYTTFSAFSVYRRSADEVPIHH